jgi:hypothetical protein
MSSQVSRICAEIDDKIKAFLHRPIGGDRPYLRIDATYVKLHQNGRTCRSPSPSRSRQQRWPARNSRPGHRPSEAETFWTAFLRKLARGDGRYSEWSWTPRRSQLRRHTVIANSASHLHAR